MSRAAYSRAWRLKNPEAWKTIQKNSYNRRKRAISEQVKREHRKDPRKHMLYAAKGRARKAGIEFALEISDIVIPGVCPIFGTPLTVSGGKGPSPFSPSLDRIDNSLGYIKGNVRVISFRANELKRDATLEELWLLATHEMCRVSKKDITP